MGRRLSPATLQGRRHGGAHNGLLQRRPPCRPVGGFSALVTSPLCGLRPRVSALRCTLLYGAPGLLLRRFVVTLPAKDVWGEEARDAYKGRRPYIEQRVGQFVRQLVQFRHLVEI